MDIDDQTTVKHDLLNKNKEVMRERGGREGRESKQRERERERVRERERDRWQWR